MYPGPSQGVSTTTKLYNLYDIIAGINQKHFLDRDDLKLDSASHTTEDCLKRQLNFDLINLYCLKIVLKCLKT